MSTATTTPSQIKERLKAMSWSQFHSLVRTLGMDTSQFFSGNPPGQQVYAFEQQMQVLGLSWATVNQHMPGPACTVVDDGAGAAPSPPPRPSFKQLKLAKIKELAAQGLRVQIDPGAVDSWIDNIGDVNWNRSPDSLRIHPDDMAIYLAMKLGQLVVP